MLFYEHHFQKQHQAEIWSENISSIKMIQNKKNILNESLAE